MLQALGMCFYLGKNALSTFAFLVFVEVCVAAIGALRFSCAAPAAHFFIYRGKTENDRRKGINRLPVH